MNDIYITLTGNVAAEPRQYSFDEGIKVTSLRVLTTHRYFDKRTGQWLDGEKVCFTVRCWRALGENVAASIRAGHPVVVSGKLRIREFGADGDRRFMPEIEASAVGHDLRWGTGAFTKPERGGSGAVSKEMRERLDEETRDWAMGPRPQRSLTRSGAREEPNPFHTADADHGQPLPTEDGPLHPSVSEAAPSTEPPNTLTPAALNTPTSNDDTAHPLQPMRTTARPLALDGDVPPTSDGSPARKRGPKSGTIRTLSAEGSTIRALDREADDSTGRDAQGRAGDAQGSAGNAQGRPGNAQTKARDADLNAHATDANARDVAGTERDADGKTAGEDDKRLTMAGKAAA
ncbi:single-stranded DNA-binding protein [Nonomuraea sp. PA05]|uniref:single-stranded DNA-binding protein n=1 Tax=Nonomuraea sp. PA05 TaxID=2604466 RepID=UPI001651DC0B|nr:single-stranded DNA-binding protein [Nonomuraea sp. PA05]